MLKLSLEKPLLAADSGKGYARYRIDFEDLDPKDKYILGWVTPWTSKKSGSEIEARHFLYNATGWRKGMVVEIYQEDVTEIKRFTVRLYRAGLIKEFEEPEGFLLEEQQFGIQQPLD